MATSGSSSTGTTVVECERQAPDSMGVPSVRLPPHDDVDRGTGGMERMSTLEFLVLRDALRRHAHDKQHGDR